MMILRLVLVFALSMYDTHGHRCKWNDFGCHLKGIVRHFFDNCYCVRNHQCHQEDISERGRCYNHFNEVDPDYVCCRNPVRFTTVRPPPRKPTNSPTQRPSFLDGGLNDKKQPQRPESTTQGPQKTSAKIPGRVPTPKPTSQVPPLTSSSQIPITNPPTQTQPSSSQSQDTSQGSPSTNTECMHTCRPPKDCNGNVEQGSCQNPNDVCCLGLVQPLDSSSQPQSQDPDPSADTNYTCNGTCTPFFKCYDEETSSNLTGLVNDRITPPDGCSDPNDVCCYNLNKITTKPAILESSSENCIGSCVPINDCPYHLNTLNEARGGNSDAVQELRKSVCSNTNGTLRVCCPPPPPPPPCQFPFIYKNATYSGCTTVDDPNEELWCSTETDDQNNHVKDQYRLCNTDDTPRAAQN